MPAPRRWSCINTLKNSSLTVALNCSLTGKIYPVPSKPPTEEEIGTAYFDESVPPEDQSVRGSTTLYDLVKMVKSQIPGLYLWDQVGGQILVCGKAEVMSDDWETTMLCELIKDAGDGDHIMLEDGREAVLVTIGTPEGVKSTKASVVTRCLAKGDVYG